MVAQRSANMVRRDLLLAHRKRVQATIDGHVAQAHKIDAKLDEVCALIEREAASVRAEIVPPDDAHPDARPERHPWMAPRG